MKKALEQYPEFRPIVLKLASNICHSINQEAILIESKMPYKAQFILEELIKELDDRV